MKKHFLLALLGGVFCLPHDALAIRGMANNAPPLFGTEAQAQNHCPSDTVVWLNLSTGVFDFRGQKNFGKYKGNFACEEESLSLGFRPTRNGQ